MEKITIAIVDDTPSERLLLRALLERSGFEVVLEAENGIEFLHKLSCAPSIPDMCIIDILMPVMNGIETTKNIRSRQLNTIIVCISAVNDPHIIREAIHSGAHHFLPKGMACQHFIDTLVELKNQPHEGIPVTGQ